MMTQIYCENENLEIGTHKKGNLHINNINKSWTILRVLISCEIRSTNSNK